MGKPFERKEIEEKHEGSYDDDGFYILEDGSFFDPWGYKFSMAEDGYCYDEFGGYYDDYGYYVPGKDHEEAYYDNYED
jgi:hypothetical protein